MKKLLLIIGMPGSGKDTQIEYMAKRRKLSVIRIGDLVREKARTDQGISKDLEAGNLVDNGVVNALVADAIKASVDGSYIISDGFPRDLPQAQWLNEYLPNCNCELDKVLYIDIDDITALERLQKRGRDDDDEATINHRLEVFHTQTDDVIDYYQKSGQLTKVDGRLDPDEVAEKIQKVLGW